MAKKREREFLTELKHSCAARGVAFYKIPDMPQFAGAKSRFNPMKPFDGFMGFDGVPIAFEAKAQADFSAFGLNAFQPQQIENLIRWHNAGHVSMVLLNVRIPRKENRMLWFHFPTMYSIWLERSTKMQELIAWPDFCHAERFRVDRPHPQTTEAKKPRPHRAELRWIIDEFLKDCALLHADARARSFPKLPIPVLKEPPSSGPASPPGVPEGLLEF